MLYFTPQKRNEIHTGSRALMRAKGGVNIADSDDDDDEKEGGNRDQDWESRPRIVKKEWKDAHDEAHGKGARLPIKMVDGTIVKVKGAPSSGTVAVDAVDAGADVDVKDEDDGEGIVHCHFGSCYFEFVGCSWYIDGWLFVLYRWCSGCRRRFGVSV